MDWGRRAGDRGGGRRTILLVLFFVCSCVPSRPTYCRYKDRVRIRGPGVKQRQ